VLFDGCQGTGVWRMADGRMQDSDIRHSSFEEIVYDEMEGSGVTSQGSTFGRSLQRHEGTRTPIFVAVQMTNLHGGLGAAPCLHAVSGNATLARSRPSDRKSIRGHGACHPLRPGGGSIGKKTEQ
jgi:hypothetical protein